MSEPDASTSSGESSSARGRAFVAVSLICAAFPSLAGLFFDGSNGQQEAAVLLVVLSPFIYLGFFIAGVVIYRRNQPQRGVGVILGSLAGALIGFGTCLALAGAI